MKTISTEMIAEATKGQCNKHGEVSSVVIDNRQAEAGSLFIAIPGERFDGHDFVLSAVNAGASAVMISRDISPQTEDMIDVPIIKVADTKKAFLDLARAYRLGFGRGVSKFPVIALTGSVGKTTTKEMIWCVANSKYKTHKTYMNWNNNIGVPKVLLGLEEDHEAAVVEMGMDHKGEISELTRTVLPDIAVVTNIGVSHIENLGSRENILASKLEVLEGMQDGAPLIINGDNDLLGTLKSEDLINKPRIIRFGIEKTADVDVTAERIEYMESGTEFEARIVNPDAFSGCTLPVDSRFTIKIPTTGVHNVYNALAATSVGLELGITAEHIAEALTGYKPAGMRENVREVGGITIIEDCYNASPDSIKALCETLKIKGVPPRRKIAVIADMLELGDYSFEAHKNAGRDLAAAGVDLLMTYGEHAKLTAESAREHGVIRVFDFDDKDELCLKLESFLKPGDVVAFKGSRGMKLEEVISKVYKLLEENNA